MLLLLRVFSTTMSFENSKLLISVCELHIDSQYKMNTLTPKQRVTECKKLVRNGEKSAKTIGYVKQVMLFLGILNLKCVGTHTIFKLSQRLGQSLTIDY